MSCYECPLREICFQASDFERAGKEFVADDTFAKQEEKHHGNYEDIADQFYSFPDDGGFTLRLELLQADAQALTDNLDKVLAHSKAVLDWSYQRDHIREDEESCPGPIITKERKWYGKIGRVTIECASESRRQRAKITEEKLYGA